jgi:leader peptidase (prepilin peptidase)/N-methyltransferase
MTALASPRPIAWRSASTGPAVGLGLIAVGLVIALSKAPDLYRLIIGLGYLGILGFIAGYDARTRRAPNRVVYPALAAATVASLTLGWSDALDAVLGGIVSFTVLLALALAGRGQMGAGDVKVGALCGLAVGLQGVIPLLLITFIVGGVAAAPLVLFGIRRKTESIAFTPFLVGSTVLCMALFRLYLWG